MNHPPTARQSRILWLALTGLAVTTIVALIVGFIWGLGRVLDILSPVLWPLAIAGVLACLLDPVVDFFERKRIPRTRAIILVFFMAVAVILGILGSILPNVVRQSAALVERVPHYYTNILSKLNHLATNPPPLVEKLLGTAGAATSTNFFSSITTLLEKVDKEKATTYVTNAASKFGPWLLAQVERAASFFGLLAGLALVPVYAFYFLLEKRGIESKWTDYLPLSNSAMKDELIFILRSINDCLIAFFRSQVLVAICDGVLYTIGFLIIGLPYAVLLGVMAVFLTMIPFLGAMATCAAALVIAFAQFGDWQHPAGVLAVFAVVQTLEGFVIQPKIMGDRIGLHPLTVIVAIMFGTTLLGGILGGILAIPVTAVARVLMFRYVWKKRSAPAPK